MTRDELLALYNQRLAAGATLYDPEQGSFTDSGQYVANQNAPSPGVYLDDGRFISRGPDGTLMLGQLDGDKRTVGTTFSPDGTTAPYDFTGRGLDYTVPLMMAAFGAGGYGLDQLGLLGGSAAGATSAAPAAAAATASPAAAAPAAAAAPIAAGAAGAAGAATLPLVDDWAANNSLLSTNPLAITPGAPFSLTGTGGGIDYARLLSNPALLAAGAGALAGIAGNDDITSTQMQTGTSSGSANTTGGQTGTTATQSMQGLAPWLQGYAQDYVGRAQQLANAPTSNQYLDRAGSLLMGSADDPLVQAARAQQQAVIGGGMLNANPYVDQVARGIGERMGDAYAVGTRANTAGRFNNDGNSVAAKSAFGQTNFLNDRAFGDSLGQAMSGLYMGNYNNERAAQDAASRNSLAFGSYGQQAANSLSNFGQQDWMRPILQNQAYGQAINPAFGSQSNATGNTAQNSWQNLLSNNQTNNQTSSTVQAPNNWMAGTGGALSALSIYNMLQPRRS
jgi:hypothetical protein